MNEIKDIDKSKEQLIAELQGIRQLVPRLERLTTQYKETERLQSALYKIADLAGSARDMGHFYSRIHEIIGDLMYAANFYIALYQEEDEIVTFPYFKDTVDQIVPDKVPFERIKRGLTAWLMRCGESALLDKDGMAKLDSAGDVELLGATPNMWMGAPLLHEDKVVGAIVVQTYKNQFSYQDRDLELLNFVSQHVSTALERKLSREDLEKRVAARTSELQSINERLQSEISERQRGEKLQQALFRIAELTNTASDMHDFFAKVHSVVAELIYARNFFVALVENEAGLITFPYRVDDYDATPKPRQQGRGLTEYVVRKGEPILLSLKDREDLEAQGEIVRSGHGSNFWMGLPLRDRGEVIGIISVQSYSPEHSYEDRDLDLMNFVSHHIAAALRRKRAADDLKKAHSELEQRVKERTKELFETNRSLEAQIKHRERIEKRLIHDALHDALTELPNRNLFSDRLAQAMKRKARNPSFNYAVLFLDLDRFKIINDSLGHLVGDELLKEVSARVLSCMRDSDTVARMGGDEFAVLLEGIGDVNDAVVIAERILERIAEPYELNGLEVFTATSIGVAYGHERYERQDDLLRDADAAMYRAKEQGRHRAEVFDESMHRHAVEQLELETFMHRAVANKEFFLEYQPIIDLENGDIVAIEALLRWNHPERGVLLPDIFLEVARETGMDVKIDWWALTAACRQMKEWVDAFPELPDLVMHVNLCNKHFTNISFPGRLEGLLDGIGLPASRVKLEVEEGALLDKINVVDEVLRKFKKMGVMVLLDDFGTRHSSLMYLHRLPMDSLKIDRSFVTRMLDVQETHAVMRTIHGLARTLDMKVIAEGVESQELFDAVKELGCDYAQGFELAKPMQAAQFKDVLKAGRIDLAEQHQLR